MNTLLLLAMIVPAGAILWGAIMLRIREKTIWSLLQLLGACGFVIVVLAHMAETFHFLPWMSWGRPDSAGHYLDLIGAVAGLILFPVGYLGEALSRRSH